MARPAGHRISRRAWDDVLRLSGRSLTNVAEMADIPRATVSGIVNGHYGASTPMAHRLADALSVHPETLFPSLIVRSTAPAEAAS